jgi:hypothetical protein
MTSRNYYLLASLVFFSLSVSVVSAKGLQTMTLAGQACEGEHLSDFKEAKPIYSLRIVTKKGKDVDELKLEDINQDGKSFSIQTVEFENGVPKNFTSTNLLLKQVNQLTVTDKRLMLELTQNGQTRKAEFDRPKLFAVGPSINRVISDSLAYLAAGKSISFQMVVVDRLAMYGFRLIKEKIDDHELLPQLKSGEWLKLKMEMEDPFIGGFAPKIYFIVDAKTGLPYYVSSPIPSPLPGKGMLGRGTIHYEIVPRKK